MPPEPAPRLQHATGGGGQLPPSGPPPKTLPKVLSRDQVAMLARAAALGPRGKRNRAMVLTTYYLAQRRSETVGMDADNLDWAAGRVRFYRPKTRVWFETEINDQLKPALMAYLGLRRTGPLFTSAKGGRLTANGYWRAIQQAAKHCGFKVRPHWLRHSRATHLISDGEDVRVVQAILSHRDIRQTEVYTHIQNRTVDRAMMRP